MTWTKDRVAALKTLEVRQLRANAVRLGNLEVVTLCDDVLGGRPTESRPRKAKRQHELDGRPLVSRSKAFEMRGVKLRNPRWSWGGVRNSDGAIVFTIWANNIHSVGDTRRYMLWGPNRGGARPWSDSAGGKERLQHCELALATGEGEGVLIYGEQRGGDLPLAEASKVTGADPHTVLRFQIQREGEEYWAVWSSRAT